MSLKGAANFHESPRECRHIAENKSSEVSANVGEIFPDNTHLRRGIVVQSFVFRISDPRFRVTSFEF